MPRPSARPTVRSARKASLPTKVSGYRGYSHSVTEGGAVPRDGGIGEQGHTFRYGSGSGPAGGDRLMLTGKWRTEKAEGMFELTATLLSRYVWLGNNSLLAHLGQPVPSISFYRGCATHTHTCRQEWRRACHAMLARPCRVRPEMDETSQERRTVPHYVFMTVQPAAVTQYLWTDLRVDVQVEIQSLKRYDLGDGQIGIHLAAGRR
ncbi:hypothetical protein F5Y07DRAFT_363271 [Xylaria sp. FL0933]|nr:hypothetical protein F5Y07DRAFT_363271 [Xylaria sp. FL0933]